MTTLIITCGLPGAIANIEVLDASGQDVTFDFTCFQG